jgi:hypothetical protein
MNSSPEFYFAEFTYSSGHEPAADRGAAARHRQPLRDVMTKTPFMGWLGIAFERFEPDDVIIRLPFRDI